MAWRRNRGEGKYLGRYIDVLVKGGATIYTLDLIKNKKTGKEEIKARGRKRKAAEAIDSASNGIRVPE